MLGSVSLQKRRKMHVGAKLKDFAVCTDETAVSHNGSLKGLAQTSEDDGDDENRNRQNPFSAGNTTASALQAHHAIYNKACKQLAVSARVLCERGGAMCCGNF